MNEMDFEDRGEGDLTLQIEKLKERIEELNRDRDILKKEIDRLAEENNNLRIMMGKL